MLSLTDLNDNKHTYIHSLPLYSTKKKKLSENARSDPSCMHSNLRMHTQGVRACIPYPTHRDCAREGVVLHSNLRMHALEFTDVTLEFTDAFRGPYVACTWKSACTSCMYLNLRKHTLEFTDAYTRIFGHTLDTLVHI
jgi:hypothetical protein